MQEVLRSLDVRPRQLSRVTGMNYGTIRNIAKKLPRKQAPIPSICPSVTYSLRSRQDNNNNPANIAVRRVVFLSITQSPLSRLSAQAQTGGLILIDICSVFDGHCTAGATKFTRGGGSCTNAIRSSSALRSYHFGDAGCDGDRTTGSFAP